MKTATFRWHYSVNLVLPNLIRPYLQTGFFLTNFDFLHFRRSQRHKMLNPDRDVSSWNPNTTYMPSACIYLIEFSAQFYCAIVECRSIQCVEKRYDLFWCMRQTKRVMTSLKLTPAAGYETRVLFAFELCKHAYACYFSSYSFNALRPLKSIETTYKGKLENYDDIH